MSIVSQAQKLDDLEDVIQDAATRHVAHGINIEQEHRLASEYNAVSRRDRRKVMVPSGADQEFYCELLPQGFTTIQEDSNGEAYIVEHTFNIWLIYGFVDGQSQSRWDQIVEGIDPHGVHQELRRTGVVDTVDAQGDPAKILFQQPDLDQDIIPLGQEGGGADTAHVSRGTIRIRDWQ